MTRWFRTTAAALLVATISASSLHSEEPRTWKLLLTTGSKSYDAFRINTSTGQAWSMDGTKWTLIKDPVAVPPGLPGTYDVQATQLPANDNWTAMRINVITGKSWYAGDGKWNEIGEP